jgi:outer membrane receptor protein involved in Fe transport
MYLNADYARSRGVEIILKSRLLKNFYADVNFNYSIATGKSSNPNDNLLVESGQIREKPLNEIYLRWDKPFQIFANLSYNHPTGLGASLRLEYETGRRYTRAIVDNIREENDVEYYQGIYEDEKPYFYISKEPTTNTDLKLYKRFELGRLSYRLFLDIQNLWDQRIARRINPFTGNGYNPGEIIPYSMIDDPNPNYDPSRFLRPRTIELGLQIFFK